MSNLPLFGLQAKDKPLVGKSGFVRDRAGRHNCTVIDQSTDGRLVKVRFFGCWRKARWIKAEEFFTQ
jgi:hypothetical protein